MQAGPQQQIVLPPLNNLFFERRVFVRVVEHGLEIRRSHRHANLRRHRLHAVDAHAQQRVDDARLGRAREQIAKRPLHGRHPRRRHRQIVDERDFRQVEQPAKLRPASGRHDPARQYGATGCHKLLGCLGYLLPVGVLHAVLRVVNLPVATHDLIAHHGGQSRRPEHLRSLAQPHASRAAQRGRYSHPHLTARANHPSGAIGRPKRPQSIGPCGQGRLFRYRLRRPGKLAHPLSNVPIDAHARNAGGILPGLRCKATLG